MTEEFVKLVIKQLTNLEEVPALFDRYMSLELHGYLKILYSRSYDDFNTAGFFSYFSYVHNDTFTLTRLIPRH